MNRKETLDKAAEAVLKERQASYGPPEESFTTIAKLWTAYSGHHFHPHDVAAMMMLLKVARIKKAPLNSDSWVDSAGYAACGSELADKLKVQETFWNSPAPLPSSVLTHE